MLKPLHRGVSGTRICEGSRDLNGTEKGDFDAKCSSYESDEMFRFLSDSFVLGTLRNQHKLAKQMLSFSIPLIVIVIFFGLFWWSVSISTSSRLHAARSYDKIQEQVVLYLSEIGELALGPSRLRELEFCSQDFENHVPCFSARENPDSGYADRSCELEPKQNCIVPPPVKYRVPLRWPIGRDVIWFANVKMTADEVLSSGSMTKRMMMMEEEQISFRSDSSMFEGIEDYSHQIAGMIGLRNVSNFIQAGIRTILDIGCGYGSFGAHLFSKQLLTMCVANYETSGSQVQLTLERGLPAMLSTFASKQLPYPSFSFDMVHCAQCGIDWDLKDGIYLTEVDRVLRPGGYFVWTSPIADAQSFLHNKTNLKKWNAVRDFTESLCWEMLSQLDKTVVWKKTSKSSCYHSRKPRSGPPLCSKGHYVESPYYRPLENCIGGTKSSRWFPVEQRTWPSRANLNKSKLAVYGVQREDFAEDSMKWKMAVNDYWPLMSPLIFSDHPKRPGDDDPTPPYNMLRNVLDMNAQFGGFNSALLESGKDVWVMNAVPTTGSNHLPLIVDRGFLGVLHDWCEAFPTYPRTYDMVHADGILSLEALRHRCSMLDLLSEIDRLLRPEGWVIIHDTTNLIESARMLTTQLKWDARVIESDSNMDKRLLVCQKPFLKKIANS
ncbi:probable pectin methyltransferase QUA2 [Cucurbita moschata]|uniref:Methyltransferase n=1 Tax=Cucurbita moschata TaxID=3662 RepID=A0A6J1HDD0_CUCMO|nr:probable pectin methyltransferase QUA2 [Cucurbita moschata]XP_022961963.1 probable pectin methyltransferase QUA2 [Cucurbita moschata]